MVSRKYMALSLVLIAGFCLCPAGNNYSREIKTSFNTSMSHGLEARSWLEIKNADIVKQKKDFSCGSGALATILKYYYNENIREEDILDWFIDNKDIEADSIEELGADKEVTISFNDLKLFAEQKDHKAVGLAVSANALKKLRHPAIIFLDIRGTEHFSVFKGSSAKFVHLADPTFGNIRMRKNRFEKSFSTRENPDLPGKILGILAEGEPNEDFLATPPATGLVYRLISGKASINK